MRVSVLLVVALFVVASASASDVDTRFLHGLGDSHYLQVESEAVGRGFHVYVMLPADYEQHADKSYPTVYVLDGGALYPLLVAYYRYLNFENTVPDAIFVGISYGSSTFKGGNYRSTDYTAASDEREYWGGAGTYQTFLSDELIPLVEQKYRSNPDRRVIFGQSLSGQFVLYTALTEPSLFWGHIASNPALHRNLPFFLQSHGSASSTGDTSRLFVASGSNDDPMFRLPAVKWMEHWSDEDDLPWLLETVTLDGHSHMSAPPASFRQGMSWLFSEE